MLSEFFNVERIMDFCYKIWYFLVINFLFVISNIPVLLFLLLVGGSQIRTYLPLFLLSLAPMAPALSAVMYAMTRLLHGTDLGARKDYWKGYKSGFLKKLVLGIAHAFVVLVFWTNIEFFTFQMPFLPLIILFILLFVLSILLIPPLYLLASRYEMTNLQLVKTAIVLMFAKPIMTLGNVAAVAIVLVAYEMVAGTAVLFMGSVCGFLIVFMNQKVLKELESRNTPSKRVNETAKL